MSWYLSLNNFPQLINLLHGLNANETAATSSQHWQPVDYSRYAKISIEEAWRRHREKAKPATVVAARRRQIEARAAASAAETSIIASQVDRNRAPSLSTLSNTPAPPPTSGGKASHIIRIVASGRTRYKVLWSEPPGEETWVSRSHMEKREEHRAVVEEYRRSIEAEEIDVSLQ